jgi:hypothetical protein
MKIVDRLLAFPMVLEQQAWSVLVWLEFEESHEQEREKVVDKRTYQPVDGLVGIQHVRKE